MLVINIESSVLPELLESLSDFHSDTTFQSVLHAYYESISPFVYIGNYILS